MNKISKIAMFKPRFLAIALVLGTFVYGLADVKAQTVTLLDRAKIGGYSEDITFVTNGPLANHIIVLDGYEVYGIPGQAHGKPPMRKLFDIKGLGTEIAPRGITYIESEKLFVLNDPRQPTKLFLFDHRGRGQGTRTIQYLNGYLPEHLEGMTYIPSSSAVFPDHVAMITWDTLGSGPSRIEVLRRDGQVVAEISPNWPSGFETETMGDVMFLSSNRLLVTGFFGDIWTVDFAGNVLAGPQIVTGAEGGEGIVQMSDGRIAYVASPQDLLFFDNNLNRLPSEDRHDVIGLNLNRPRAIAWNSDTNNHLISHLEPPSIGLTASNVAAVPPSLDIATEAIDLVSGGFLRSAKMTYLPDEHLIAIAHDISPRAILLYDNSGSLVEQLSLVPNQRPGAITYIPTTAQFGVRVAAELQKLRIYSRTGALVRTIDLSSIGVTTIVGVAFFNPSHPSGGQFLIIDNSLTNDRAVITDFNGNLLGEFNYRSALGLPTPTDVSAITTGPQAGAFSMVDAEAGEIVIFRLN